MLGAIAGDIIGSVHEGKAHFIHQVNKTFDHKIETKSIKRTDFPLFVANCSFTDDTVLTIAVADAILNQKPYAVTIREYALQYPDRGYGGSF